MEYIIPCPSVPTVPVVGTHAQFPVRRIYCVGRNYEDHAKEMGFTGREAPFFFMKPADSIVVCDASTPTVLPYPSLTHNLHHEIELVIAIGQGGKNIAANEALRHVYGYATGLDMTRRDLQNDMKKQGRPWCIGKGFDHAAPMGSITPAAQVPEIAQASISLSVNGQQRQHSQIGKMIWNVAEIIEHISKAWELSAGDLIFTGTPEGVSAVVSGDVLQGSITGLTPIQLQYR